MFRSLTKLLSVRVLSVSVLASLLSVSVHSDAFELNLDKTETIPFVMRAGYPFVDITISGVTHNLLIDMTDYRQITLSSKVLEHTPHKVQGTEKYGGANDKIFFLKKFALEEVKLGNLVKTNVKGTEEAFDPNYPTPSPSGAIGAAMFFDGILEFDFHKSQLKVTPNGKMPACEPLASLGIPLVTLATFRGEKLTFFLDIAYQYSVIDSGVVLAQQLAQHPRQVLPNQNKGSETRNLPSMFTVDELSFENFTLNDIRFVPLPMADSGIQGVLGMDVFRRYNLAIDFPNNCFNLPLAKSDPSSKASKFELRIPENF